MDTPKRTVLCFLTVLTGAALPGPNGARAEYRCDSPRTEVDRLACEKATEGPEALREYIQRMRSVETLYFYDYVNEDRLVAWRKLERKVEPPVLQQQAQGCRGMNPGVSKAAEIPRVRSG